MRQSEDCSFGKFACQIIYESCCNDHLQQLLDYYEERADVMGWIRSMINKHRDILLYIFFGALTTAVNYVVFFLLLNVWNMSGAFSSLVSWIAAVIFAFFTNKPFVFKSMDWSFSTVKQEFAKFVGCRIGSGLIDIGIIFLTVDILRWDGNILKILTSILVVILNYIFSKKIVFK